MKRSSGSHRPGGFTLIEVIAAMTILALVTGSIYALLRQSVQAAADLETSELADQGVRRFLELCRSTLETLPGDATLSLATAEETGTAQELTLSGVPEAFSVGPEPTASSDLVLGLRMAASTTGSATEAVAPLYEVAITREEFAPKAESGDFQIRAGSGDGFYQPDEQGRYWLPLLAGIRSLEWRYWNDTDRIWEDDWSQAPDRPTLLEMQLWPDNRAAPLRAVFAIPPAVETVQADTTGSAANAAGENPNGTPGANQRGGDGRPGDARGRDGGGRDGGRGIGGGDRGPGRNRGPGDDRGPGGERGPGGDRGPGGERGPGGGFGNGNNPGGPPQPGAPGGSGPPPPLPPPP